MLLPIFRRSMTEYLRAGIATSYTAEGRWGIADRRFAQYQPTSERARTLVSVGIMLGSTAARQYSEERITQRIPWP